MESVHDLFLRRHSIRRYTAEPVSPDDVKTILEAGLLAPSSKSGRPWQFVVVEDKDMLEHLSKCKPAYAASIKNAPLAIVVCASPAKSDCFIEDASVASTMMLIQAAALGLGACWVEVRNRYRENDESAEEYVQQSLGIPFDLPIISIITVGHPDEERRPVDPSKLLWEKVHIGSFRNDDFEAAQE